MGCVDGKPISENVPIIDEIEIVRLQQRRDVVASA